MGGRFYVHPTRNHSDLDTSDFGADVYMIRLLLSILYNSDRCLFAYKNAKRHSFKGWLDIVILLGLHSLE